MTRLRRSSSGRGNLGETPRRSLGLVTADGKSMNPALLRSIFLPPVRPFAPKTAHVGEYGGRKPSVAHARYARGESTQGISRGNPVIWANEGCRRRGGCVGEGGLARVSRGCCWSCRFFGGTRRHDANRGVAAGRPDGMGQSLQMVMFRWVQYVDAAAGFLGADFCALRQRQRRRWREIHESVSR